ncbi:COMM domain-containing protein 8 [Halotydeus destructor]|nr:COMM domain-containing protein 8 [Halotydeus destructor]
MDVVSLVEKCPQVDLYKLVHQVIDELCGRQNGLSRENLVPTIWNEEQFTAVATYCRQFYINSLTNEKNSLTNASEDVRKVLLECLEVRKNELKNGIVQYLLETSTKTIMSNFDWQLKTIIASDKLVGIEEKILNLDIETVRGSHNHLLQRNVISIEMNLKELDLLIEKLEEAQLGLAKKA